MGHRGSGVSPRFGGALEEEQNDVLESQSATTRKIGGIILVPRDEGGVGQYLAQVIEVTVTGSRGHDSGKQPDQKPIARELADSDQQ